MATRTTRVQAPCRKNPGRTHSSIKGGLAIRIFSVVRKGRRPRFACGSAERCRRVFSNSRETHGATRAPPLLGERESPSSSLAEESRPPSGARPSNIAGRDPVGSRRGAHHAVSAVLGDWSSPHLLPASARGAGAGVVAGLHAAQRPRAQREDLVPSDGTARVVAAFLHSTRIAVSPLRRRTKKALLGPSPVVIASGATARQTDPCRDATKVLVTGTKSPLSFCDAAQSSVKRQLTSTIASASPSRSRSGPQESRTARRQSAGGPYGSSPFHRNPAAMAISARFLVGIDQRAVRQRLGAAEAHRLGWRRASAAVAGAAHNGSTSQIRASPRAPDRRLQGASAGSWR